MNKLSIESLVVPSISLTITLFCPSKELVREDFPTFGLPIRHILILSSSYSISSITGNSSITLSSKSPIPTPCLELIGTGSPRPSA